MARTIGSYGPKTMEAIRKAGLRLIFEHGYEAMSLRQLDLAIEGKDDPLEKLRAFVAFHVTYHMTRKREVFIANSELRSLEPRNYEAIVALRGAYEQRLAGILADGAAKGVFAVADVQVATFAIIALLTGLCTWYRPGGRLTREAIIEAHEKLVLSGVMPASSGASIPVT